MTTIYLLMDGRAHTDPDKAEVYAVAKSLQEARRDRDDCPEDGTAIVEAELVKTGEYRVIRVVE